MKQKKRKEIRVVDPSQNVWDTVTKLAKQERRTIGKQAEHMIEIAIKYL